jgi:hypothetical protein
MADELTTQCRAARVDEWTGMGIDPANPAVAERARPNAGPRVFRSFPVLGADGV